MKNKIIFIMALFGALQARAQHEVDCPFTSINSTISTNTTLSATTLYRVEGCVHVTSGATLTIPGGTVLLFEKASNAGLAIDKGAYLLVQGTSSNPVVFTSDQQPGYRNPGDYSGLILNGTATNNFSGNVMTGSRTCSIDAGGTDDDDSSGALTYLRMEYGDYGITFASVGRKTVVENLMVSYCEKNAFEFLGGTVQAKNLIAFNATEHEFVFNYGNRSKVQRALGLRLDASANYGTPPYSNGVLIANNEDAGAGYAGSPQTRPILDKFSLLGPAYCGATGLSSNFKNAVLAYHNAQMGMYHSILSSWPVGFKIEDASTLTNATASPQNFKFEANSLDNHTTDYSHNGTWVTGGGCATNMANWMTNIGSCAQRFNEFSPGSLGYDGSVCEDFCEEEIPSFIMADDELGDTAYFRIPDLATDNFFVKSAFRGAFDETTDWTQGWTVFCPQATDYCAEKRKAGTPIGITEPMGAPVQNLLVAPNPAHGRSKLLLTANRAGKAQITILNNKGEVKLCFTKELTEGTQQVELDVTYWQPGIYFIRILMPDYKMLSVPLMVK